MGAWVGVLGGAERPGASSREASVLGKQSYVGSNDIGRTAGRYVAFILVSPPPTHAVQPR